VPSATRDAPLLPDPGHSSAGRLSPSSDVADFLPTELDAEGQRDAYGQPDVQPETNARSQLKVKPTKLRARGTATWFCEDGVSPCHYARSGGMYAAAGAEIRIGDWRGRKVTVCAGDDCIQVTLIDWCGCPGERVIDLYGDAFRQLSPLSEGVIPVTVRW
jgi:Lytic transglycolase